MYTFTPSRTHLKNHARYTVRLLIAVLVTTTASVLLAISTYAFAAPPPAWLSQYIEKCNQGHIADCFTVAVAYSKGGLAEKNQKVDADKLLADKYLKKGMQIGQEKCNRGSKYECYKMGILYFEGLLLPSDFARGLDYMQRACRGGYKQACEWMQDSGIPVQ